MIGFFEHLNLGLEFPLRSEFAEYVRWVAGFFAKDVAYNQAVTAIQVDPVSNLYCVTTQAGNQFFARSLVLAPDQVFHLTQYLGRLSQLAQQRELKRVAVVGGSSAEAKKNINRHLHYTNYSAADADVIAELYVGMYEDKLQGRTGSRSRTSAKSSIAHPRRGATH